MATPYIGEIRMFGGNFAPAGWAFCDGSLIAISENEALFNLIGTTYGGDGQSTFALPDLRGRVPIHQGTNLGTTHVIGEQAGSETITLTTGQIPSHSHALVASANAATSTSPTNAVLAQTAATNIYSSTLSPINMSATMLSQAGGSQPHDNMMPFQCISFIISLYGVYPSQT